MGLEKDGISCPKCAGREVWGRGKGRYQCQTCGTYFREETKNTITERISESGDAREFTTLVPLRIVNEKELISQCEIDTETWEIERWVCNKWEMGSKDLAGNVHVQELYQVKVWLRKKVKEIEARDAIRDMLEDARSYAPRYDEISRPAVSYPAGYDGGYLYELDMPDLHFGKLAWAEETGQDYDIKIAAEGAHKAFAELLGYARNFPVARILLPLGNDYFNSNGAGETTVNGTKQVEDTRWQKTFRKGRQLLVELVEQCMQVAPVDVLVIPGNHDRERMFYLGDALECWFHNCKDVCVDNNAKERKFYEFGKNMIMFAHGEEKRSLLPSLMALEEPEMWGRAKHREAHVGHWHHKEVLYQKVKEELGVVIRLMRSLTPPDEWHYRNGYLGAEQAAQSFLWHPEKGVVGEFASMRE